MMTRGGLVRTNDSRSQRCCKMAAGEGTKPGEDPGGEGAVQEGGVAKIEEEEEEEEKMETEAEPVKGHKK